MINVRIEEKPAFRVIGKKTFISGTNTSLFEQFWIDCKQNGLIKQFNEIRNNSVGEVTKSTVLGVSCVEKDPNNRSFNFYVALESNKEVSDLEHCFIPKSKWAIFSNKGEIPHALIDAEMYAFRKWLPNSSYKHALAPELEVYLPSSNENTVVEFWLPIESK